VRALVEAHAQGIANVALVAVSASERQPGDVHLNNYSEFEERVIRLGLDHLPVLHTIAIWNIGFYGMGLLADKAMVDRERAIHAILFPGIPFDWPAFAASVGVGPETVNVPEAKRWRNALCDRQMYWAHDHGARDVFVTSDRNFRKLMGASDFPNARVMDPESGAALIVGDP
jgi:hypothetical protein